MPMQHLKQHMERTFRQLAADKGLDFNVEFDAKLPETIRTDEKRLQQVVLNLLSNAFKFTAKGGVTLARAVRGQAAGAPTTRCCATPTRRSRSPSPTPASASPRTSRS